MAWSLQIHHIGLNRRGDATLLLAINDGLGPNQMPQVRSVLIDGGMYLDHAYVNLYIHACLAAVPLAAGAPRLNVMAVTHYDNDHFRGITSLLRVGGQWGPPNIYDNVTIFDPGFSEGSNDNSYLGYVFGIGYRGVRSRVTRNVLGTINLLPPPAPPGGWQPGNWLLNREIMWTNAAGAPVTPAGLLGAGVAAITNTNPPTVTCIAANQFVPLFAGRVGGMGADLRNEHSLGFIVRFNNFRYYLAGDLETAQEHQVRLLLNPTNDLAGRVVAMKASHHGGNTSTSRAFLDRLKPDAAFISCGNSNQHSHPAQEVVNVLGGYAWAVPAHAAAPPASPFRPVPYYLTGYQMNGPPPLSFGDQNISYAAGDPTIAPRIPGDIALTVTQAQSLNDQRGESYFGVREAVRWAARGTGVPNPAATAIGNMAAVSSCGPGINSRLAAVQAAAAAAATAAGAGPAIVAAAGAFAGFAMGGWGVGHTSSTIANYTAAQMQAPATGATPTQAAVAGAAAGAAFASGERNSARKATRHALLGVGVAPAAAANRAASCIAAITVAVGAGLFDVAFHDFFMLPAAGLQNINHTG